MAPLEETVKKAAENRQPQDIIIDALLYLRTANGKGVAQTTLRDSISIPPTSWNHYLSYLCEKRLISARQEERTVRLYLTELGGTIPLEPTQFADLQSPDGRRTALRLRKDIVAAIDRNGGAATLTQIMYGAVTSRQLTVRRVQQMITDGILQEERQAHQQKNRNGTLYLLTPKGRQQFPYTEQPDTETDKWLKILEAAENGIDKYGLMCAAETNTPLITKRIQLLLDTGLLELSGNKYCQTPFCRALNKEALPYALDTLANPVKRTQNQIEMDILNAIAEPATAYKLISLNVASQTSCVNGLESLTGRHYVFRARNRATAAYQRTTEGEAFLSAVHETLSVLEKHAAAFNKDAQAP